MFFCSPLGWHTFLERLGGVTILLREFTILELRKLNHEFVTIWNYRGWPIILWFAINVNVEGSSPFTRFDKDPVPDGAGSFILVL